MSQSGSEGVHLPSLEEWAAMREGPTDAQRREHDQQVAQLHRDIREHALRVEDALQGLREAVQLGDDHEAVVRLRQLLSLGYLGKPIADRLLELLPQPERLF